jgi:hypothetical protein
MTAGDQRVTDGQSKVNQRVFNGCEEMFKVAQILPIRIPANRTTPWNLIDPLGKEGQTGLALRAVALFSGTGAEASRLSSSIVSFAFEPGLDSDFSG